MLSIQGGDIAFAAAAKAPDETRFLVFLGLLFNIAMFLMYTCIKFLSILIDPEIIFAINDVGDGLLLKIWQTSRNIVNVIFAFMLVFAAIYTVVTAKKDLIMAKWHKFILAVILVNFSWFFPRIILDTANVLTATIYSINGGINEECKMYDLQGKQIDCVFLKDHYFFPDSLAKKPNNNMDKRCIGNVDPNNQNVIKNEFVCMIFDKLPTDTNTGMGILHGMYINHIRIIHAGRIVDVPASNEFVEVIRFIIQFILVLVYFIAALFPIAAMTVVFFIRIPIIWFTVAFMPFMFIGFIMGDKMGEFDTLRIFKHFVKAAFLPTVVAIPLTIGFIMISAGIQSPCPAVIAKKIPALCQGGGFQLFPGLSTTWIMLWNVLALVVIWLGFFFALKIDTIYERTGVWFRNAGQSLAKLPLAMPIIPVGGGKFTSAKRIGEVSQQPDLAFSYADKGESIGKVLRDTLSKTDNTDPTVAPKRQKEVTDALGGKDNVQQLIRSNKTNMQKLAKAINDKAGNNITVNEAINAVRTNNEGIIPEKELSNKLTNLKAKLVAGRKK